MGQEDTAHKPQRIILQDEAEMGTALTVTICPRALFCQLRLGARDIKHNATLLLIKDCADCSACLVHAMPVKPNMHWFSSDHHAMLSLGIRPQHGRAHGNQAC